MPRLWRSRADRVVAGVLGGLSEKFGWETRPVRLLFTVLMFVSGFALLLPYVAVWAVAKVHGPPAPGPRWWRSRSKHVVAGVLGGMAEKFDTSQTLLRILFVALTACTAVVPGVVFYLMYWVMTQPRYAPHDSFTAGSYAALR